MREGARALVYEQAKLPSKKEHLVNVLVKTDTTPRGDIGARPVSVSRQLDPDLKHSLEPTNQSSSVSLPGTSKRTSVFCARRGRPLLPRSHGHGLLAGGVLEAFFLFLWSPRMMRWVGMILSALVGRWEGSFCLSWRVDGVKPCFGNV